MVDVVEVKPVVVRRLRYSYAIRGSGSDLS